MKYKLLSLAILASACSVRNDRVNSVPPNFVNVQNLGVEYGKIALTSVAIFLWAEMPSSAEAVLLYKDVAQNAAKSDQLELQRQKTQSQLDALNANGFDYSPCFKNFEQACSASPPSGMPSCDDIQLNNDSVQNWVFANVDLVPTVELKKLYSACRDFTDTKLGLKNSLEKLMASGLELTAKILYRIDPEYQKTGIQTNYKSFKNPNGSSIVISQSPTGDQVELRLDGFSDAKNYQTNIDGTTTFDGAEFKDGQIFDAIYNHESKALKFKVPEVLNGKATGGVYAFVLERNNFSGNPRFSGDVVYTNGSVKQTGSAKFDGQFSQ